ncbi:hypothetical protein A0H81_08803 [Grifola frondosa]|uniref:Uncharacterized protein n=1 Tax=Grifola frondosa TaxID=5627 RepID=A0A1C7M3L3_GRIFR|nr:hypothetical protein A0H81_08803 [Grifola frondosa]
MNRHLPVTQLRGPLEDVNHTMQCQYLPSANILLPVRIALQIPEIWDANSSITASRTLKHRRSDRLNLSFSARFHPGVLTRGYHPQQ